MTLLLLLNITDYLLLHICLERIVKKLFFFLFVWFYIYLLMKLKFGHINLCSLIPKLAAVDALLAGGDFDVLGITETWLGEDLMFYLRQCLVMLSIISLEERVGVV